MTCDNEIQEIREKKNKKDKKHKKEKKEMIEKIQRKYQSSSYTFQIFVYRALLKKNKNKHTLAVLL